MALTLDGNGTIGGLSAGGLPDASIAQADLATGVAGTGPAFSAYQGTTQSLANNTFTKAQINTEEFDTNNNYDPTTNYRFTPTVAGYYQVTAAAATATSGRTTGAYVVALYKNGSIFKSGLSTPYTSGSNPSSIVSTVMYLNGTTDYVELYVWQNSGSTDSVGIYTGSANTYFSAALVRAA